MRHLVWLAWVLCACATTKQAAPVAEVKAAATPASSAPAEVALPPPVKWSRPAVPAALEPVTRVVPESRVVTLSNGLRVVIVADPRASVVKVRLLLATGSASDAWSSVGATYFALAILGDRFDRHDDMGAIADRTEKSARYLALVKGASLQFRVSADASWLGIDGYARTASVLLKQLYDVVSARRHGDESFMARLQGAVDDLNELELTDGAALEDALSQLAFGTDHPYSRPQTGTTESLSRLGVEDASARQDAMLTPKGSTLLIAGAVDADQLERDARRIFGGWQGRPPPRVIVPAPRVEKRREVVLLPRKPSRNTLLCLTRPLSDLKGSQAAAALAVAVTDRRLNDTLRETLGYTYSVNGLLVRRRAASALLACGRLSSAEANNGMGQMLQVFADLKTKPPTLEEIDRARAMAVTELDAAQDDLDGIVASWVSAFELGLERPPADTVAKLRAVTVEQVGAAAAVLSDTSRLQVVASGEKPTVEAVTRAHSLGKLRVPVLQRIEEE